MRYWKDRHKPRGAVEPAPAARIDRQKRKRMTADAEYRAMRDIYLEENPLCALCGVGATAVHHIVKGTAGRARSLLNCDTWLGLCQTCHDTVDGWSWEQQVRLKQDRIMETVERLGQ